MTVRLLLFSLFFHSISHAQTYMSGSVADAENKSPISFCAIALKTAKDSSIITSTVTDEFGKFQLLNVKSGKYILQASFVGYTTFSKQVIIASKPIVENISLQPSTQNLKQVEIVFEKETVKKEAGKTTYDIAKAATNTGGTLEDVLRNLPNVTVDQRGNIGVVGKKSVTVWLDGKPSTMAEVDVAAFLKSIPAASIEKIEVITNPSVKYDAAGSGGIIHVHLKKEKRDGFNGNVSVGYGYLTRGSANTNLNYRKDKWTLFGSYAINRSYNGHIYNEDRRIILPDTAFYYDMKNKGISYSLSNTAKLGLDFAPNEKTVFSLSSSVVSSLSDGDGSTRGVKSDGSRAFENLLLTNNQEKGNSFTVITDFSVRNTIDTNGREVSASITHSYVNSKNTPSLQTATFDRNNNEILAASLNRKTPTTNDIQNIIAQFDFSQPTTFKAKLETGLKNETTINKNTYNVFDLKNENFRRDTLLSNNFKYVENIAAFYTLLSGSFTDWLSYTAGLRMEHSFISSSSSQVNRNYLSLFPNASLAASFKDKHTLSIAYDRRIDRPTFQQINNSIVFNDPYSTWQGNPNLRPVFSDEVALNYSFMQKKWMLSIDASGTSIGGSYTEGTKLDSLGISRSQYINGANSLYANVGIYTKFNFVKWWELQMNHSYLFQHFSQKEGINNGSIQGHQYNLWASTTFKFWKNASIQISGWMNTGGVGPQGRGFPSGSIGAAIKKSFLKDKLTVTINGVNLANTMNFRWEINNGGLYTLGKWQVLNRTVFLNLSYSFGSTNKIKRIERTENSRLQGGGR